MESLFHLALLGNLASQVAQIEPAVGVPTAIIAQDFHGYPCTQNCSGHKAGYAWAHDKHVVHPDSCGGNSNSFIEGCRAAAEEAQNDDNDEDSDEPERKYDQ